MAIILRNTKGAPLTHVEMDNNLNELDTRINDLETGSTNPLVFANGADITAVESPANTITISNTSTLDTVTGRGATTTNNITVGQATVNSAINFVSPNSSNTMTASINNSDVLTISGDSGVLFSITETPDSTLKVFDSVNNLVLEVAQNGNIILNETVGYTLIGSGSAVGTNKLQVTGAANVTGNFTVGGVITGDGGGITFSTLGGIPTTVSGYGITDFDSSVDTHLNTSTATTGQVLTWNGSDYTWNTVSAGSSGIALTDLSVTVAAAGSANLTYDNVNGIFTYTPPDLSSYLTSYTETDPVVGAITGIVKADGAGNISAAVAGTDYIATETDPVVGAITGIVKADGAGNISAAVAGTDYLASYTETDPVVGAVTGIVKSDGAGNISAAVAGTDYLTSVAFGDLTSTPTTVSGYGITDFNSSVNTHLNIGTATAGEFLSWNGLDYNWISINSTVDTHINTGSASAGEILSWNGLDYEWVADSGIALTDLSVTVAAAGSANLAYDNTTGIFTYTPPDLSSYLTTETDPVVGAITGIVKADGAGNISAAIAGTDYVATETDPVVGAVTGIVKSDGAGNISAAVAGTDYLTSVAFGDLTSTPTTISGYGITDFDSSVDTHLNTGTATTNQILTWDGADYDWVSEVIVDSVNYRFILGANGTTDFTFSDAANIWFPTTENDPVLYLRRGETYIFQNDSSETFEIRVSNGGAAYSTGVTNNAASTGDIIFKVPMSAPATLYYQSTVNSGMGNTINIV